MALFAYQIKGVLNTTHVVGFVACAVHGGPPKKTCYVASLTTSRAFKESLEAHASQAIY